MWLNVCKNKENKQEQEKVRQNLRKVCQKLKIMSKPEKVCQNTWDTLSKCEKVYQNTWETLSKCEKVWQNLRNSVKTSDRV
jgi:hypothetical protein